MTKARLTNKSNIFYWGLYDFANSIPVIVFFLYFSQWLVIDNHVADIWYNLLFVGSSLLLLLTGPVVSVIVDRVGNRLQLLRWVSYLQVLFLLICSISASLFGNSSLSIFIAAVAFILANYFYLFSFSFYTPILNSLALPKDWGFVSGVGQFFNYSGQIFGLIVTLPFVLGSVYLIGQTGRSQAFLPATLLFTLFALPMLLLFKDSTSHKKETEPLPHNLRQVKKSFIELWRTPNVGRFLLAFFFFNDAMITVVNNFPIVLSEIFHVSDAQKSYLVVGILATAGIGALLSGWVSDRIGLKKSLLIILGSWIVIFPVMSIIPNFWLFTLASILMGFFFGASWTVSRTIMASLTPPDQLNHGFTYYTLAERFSTFFGPIAWGLITTLLFSYGSIRYRIAIAGLTIFMIIGFWIIKDISLVKTKE